MSVDGFKPSTRRVAAVLSLSGGSRIYNHRDGPRSTSRVRPDPYLLFLTFPTQDVREVPHRALQRRSQHQPNVVKIYGTLPFLALGPTFNFRNPVFPNSDTK